MDQGQELQCGMSNNVECFLSFQSVRKRMEEAGRRILAVFGRLQERLLKSKAEKTRTLAEQQEVPYPSRKQHPRKEEILLEKVHVQN